MDLVFFMSCKCYDRCASHTHAPPTHTRTKHTHVNADTHARTHTYAHTRPHAHKHKHTDWTSVNDTHRIMHHCVTYLQPIKMDGGRKDGRMKGRTYCSRCHDIKSTRKQSPLAETMFPRRLRIGTVFPVALESPQLRYKVSPCENSPSHFRLHFYYGVTGGDF